MSHSPLIHGELRYGRTPLRYSLPEGMVGREYALSSRPVLCDWEESFRRAVRHPVGTPPLAELAREARSIAVIVGDQYRDGPKQRLLELLLQELAPASPERVTLFLANGTHAPGPPESAGLDQGALPPMLLVNHDCRDGASLQRIGITRRGTPVELNRHYLDCDLRISLGQIKPHYFAGLSGGIKGLFPGLGGHESISINHKFKREKSARPGILDGNPVREDLEEAGVMARHHFIVDVVLNEAHEVADIEAGHFVAAHRRLARRALPWWRMPVRRAPVVVVSDGPPLTANLYQACKLLAVGGWCLQPGGTLILAAECPEGIGPVQAVNHRIFEDGIRNFLPEGTRIQIVSSMSREEVARTSFAQWAPDFATALSGAASGLTGPVDIAILPVAGNIIPDPEDPA